MFQPMANRTKTIAVHKIGEDVRLASPHALRILLHYLKAGSDMGREIDLIDHEQIRANNAGSALTRDFLALRYVDHINQTGPQAPG